MGSPEARRQLRQHGADIDSLYELVSVVDRKVDELDARFEVLETKVDARFEVLEAKVDAGFSRIEAALIRLAERSE